MRLLDRIVPELARFQDRRDRAKEFRAARLELRQLTTLCSLGLAPLLAGTIGLAGAALGDAKKGLHWAGQSLGLLFWFSFIVVTWVLRSSLRRSLRQRLRKYGVRLCIRCGYDMANTPSNRCPECGVPVPPMAQKEQAA